MFQMCDTSLSRFHFVNYTYKNMNLHKSSQSNYDHCELIIYLKSEQDRN